jgi:hypothetical protein
VLHRAAAVGNVEFLIAVQDSFGKQIGFQPSLQQIIWVLMVHQTLAGDTALHAAARTGNLRGAKAVYRLFHHDELDVDNERRGLDPDSGEPPVEDWVWDDTYSFLSSLVFVCTKNHADRDAAAEARAAGHEDLAVWFDSLAQRLDQAGKRADDHYMQYARRAALRIHWYYDEREREGTA